MSRPILLIASRRALYSLTDISRPLTYTRSALTHETRLPIRLRGANGFGVRCASAAAAVRDPEEYEEDRPTEQYDDIEAAKDLRRETSTQTSSAADQTADAYVQPSLSERPNEMASPPPLPDSVVTTIAEEVYEWDQKQNARRERKQARRAERKEREAVDERTQPMTMRDDLPSRSRKMDPPAKPVEKQSWRVDLGFTREERRKIRKEEKKAKRANERAMMRGGLVDLPPTAGGEEDKSRLQIRTESRLAPEKKARELAAAGEQDEKLSMIEQAVLAARKHPKPFSGSSPNTKPPTSLFSSTSPSRKTPVKSPRAALRASRPSRTRNSNLHALPPDAPTWKVQKTALSAKFGEQGWTPRKKLSPDAQRGIRDLHAQNPTLYSTPVLAKEFEISPEAVRRILRSKWMDSLTNPKDETEGGGGKGKGGGGWGSEAKRREGEEKMRELRERWAKRYDRIWDQKNQLGLLPERRMERRVEGREEGSRRIEEEMWRKEVLEKARRDDPLWGQ